MEITRIFDILDRYHSLFTEKSIALASKDTGEWKYTSTQEYIYKTNVLSYGLLGLGIKKGDKIASITFNRPEWNMLDMAIQQLGAIHIPIYPTISDSDYQYILHHAEVSLIFVAGEEMYRRIKHIVPTIPTLKAVYTFRNLFGMHHLGELIEQGAANPNPRLLAEIKDSILKNDIATIIYTSGTTGNPKGVMLTHENIVSNIIACSSIPQMGASHRGLSFLPLCHIYERTLNYVFQYLGISIYYVDNLANIADYALEVKPHIMATVPRVLEKMYDKIITKGEKLENSKRKIFNWAIGVASKYDTEEKSTVYKLKLAIARLLMLNRVRTSMGGELDLIISGGAALPVRLLRFFWACNIRVLEGYGMSETSPVISANRFIHKGVKFGTVGKALEGVTIKIADDGEILCKGPNVMLGYYKETEQTSETIDSEGWFHTGDIGVFDKQKRLKITDRKKLIFKTSFGKYVAPQLVENILKESIHIDHLMVIGENQKFAGAIICPNFASVKEWAKINGVQFTNNTDLIKAPEIKKLFQNEVNKGNMQLGETEQVKKFELTDTEWSVATGELSATLKLRRTTLTVKYKDLIDKIFPTHE